MAKKQTSTKGKSDKETTFEESLAALETVVHQLEEGNVGLGASLEAYEQGIKHLKSCYQALKDAERKIELLAGVDDDGNASFEPFDDTDMPLEEKAASRSRRRSRAEKKPDTPPGDDGNVSRGELF